MPFTFRKSFRIAPGVRLNLGRRSASVSVGTKRVRRTWATTGRTTDSADLPGPFGWRRSRRR
ncbi:DUF4236 domain-containing protein [Streptomyces sp. UG1]|uniref:DUF4236 domain-containing protein n=1 Tax=Streptomyces sp. UG1 TaxID=3417652 RepID=UPI003CF1FF5E